MKIALAGLAYQTVVLGRTVVGKSDSATVRRGGAHWHLDLGEGIDFSIYLLGAFEKATVQTLKKLIRLGDVAFDIGANIGAHTLGLAQGVGPTGRVFAFEPADFAFAKLKRNLALNPELLVRTDARQVMLAAEPNVQCEAEIYASWPLKTHASVHPKHRGRLVSSTHASVDSLDNFMEREGIERVNLIKIDVDGFEYPVLKGGLKTLAKFRPTLVMEMSPYVHAEHNQSFRDLVSLLRDCGYRLQDASTWKSIPLQSDLLEALIPDGASINVIARASENSA
jgi:FkbM family methyltransferase